MSGWLSGWLVSCVLANPVAMVGRRRKVSFLARPFFEFEFEALVFGAGGTGPEPVVFRAAAEVVVVAARDNNAVVVNA